MIGQKQNVQSSLRDLLSKKDAEVSALLTENKRLATYAKELEQRCHVLQGSS